MIKSLLSEPSVAFLFNHSVALRYFTGEKIDEGYVVLTDCVTAFVDLRYFYAAKQLLEKKGVECLPLYSISDVKNYLINKGVTKLYIDYDKTTLSEYEKYKEFGVEIYNGTKDFNASREIKTEFELQSISKACEITQKAFYSAVERVKEGMTERELADLIDTGCVKLGAEGAAFETIVAFGENSAVPHHQTSNRKLTLNTPILIDTGCVVNGYRSDLTRTFYFGTPSEKFVKAYDQVLNANLIAIKSIKEGCLTSDADAYARNYLESYGVADKFTHSLGHGVGLEVHESPTLSPKATPKPLKEGTVFTIEPGLYYDGEFGIRIEDTVVLQRNGVKRLFTDEKNLLIIKQK
ncbi:MAG: aminopeptidase P family protein [Clostridia bacterium]|nr:aminopeptidase P family protein [Clostridia bacterium]